MSDESPVLQTPGGGQYRRINALPDDERDLLKEMVREQRQTNERLGRIEKELLGEEGSRENGLIFRLAKTEQELAILKWVAGTAATVAIGLLIVKIAGVVGVTQ